MDREPRRVVQARKEAADPVYKARMDIARAELAADVDAAYAIRAAALEEAARAVEAEAGRTSRLECKDYAGESPSFWYGMDVAAAAIRALISKEQ